MKYTLFSEAAIGSTLRRPVLVTAINEMTARNGNSFVKLTMKDGQSEQTATMFDTTEKALADNKGVVKNCVVDVELKVTEYQGAKSFTVNNISVHLGNDITINDFVKVPPVDINKMYNELCEMVRSTANDFDGKYTPIADLTIKILEDLKDRYITSSAAISMHHNLRGGLLYHSYRMAQAADAVCGVYSILDRELMICGAALHDIGKIWEYKTYETGEAEFTSGGVLFGHLYLGASLIKKYTDNQNYNMEKVQMLIHMILSHHGQLEWGAVAFPATPEAMALHFIDNLDAKMYAFEENYESLKPGSLTEKRPFGFDTRIYKPDFLK